MKASCTAIMLAAVTALPLCVGADQPAPGEWRHELKPSPTDGKRTCSVRKGLDSDLPYIWFLYKPGGVWAGVVGEMSLGDPQSFQVDGLPPIEEADRLTGARVRTLLQQIRAGGKTLTVRFIEFPGRNQETQVLDLSGIVPHLDACKVVMATKPVR